LETFYGAFDKVAKRRGIFKVETVGDCYVAVAGKCAKATPIDGDSSPLTSRHSSPGLPLPRKDHAVAMVRFARDCLTQINDLSHQMEVSLGPDTADLSFRVGLHSGAVTGMLNNP
jgi:class 3 adenylate cyclase